MGKNFEMRSIRVLIVEDNRTQAEYLRYILEKDGYSVIVAANGFEAIEILKEELPALILTDVIMPEIDGYELCKLIKKDERTAKIPVILVTNLYDSEDVIKGLESGADNFIIKPYNLKFINSRIESTLKSASESDPDGKPTELDVIFDHSVHTITASRLQILNIHLSTYEIAIKNNSELELANRKLRLLSDITRHDLKNRLIALESYLVLLENTTDISKIQEIAHKIMKIAMSMQSQINFTKDYQDLGIAAPQWHNIHKLINRVEEQLDFKNVTLINKIKNIEVYSDPLLEKVFYNLFDNSLNYGEKISKIELYSSISPDGLIIAITDDGIGIKDEEKKDIFSRGFGKNTGFGLFLSKEILSITGISIQEDGIPGNGACFEILVPPDMHRLDNEDETR